MAVSLPNATIQSVGTFFCPCKSSKPDLQIVKRMDSQQQRNAIQHELHRMKPLGDHLKATAIHKVSTAVDTTSQAPSGSILLISLAFFAAQYAIAWTICFRKWRGQKRYRACSSCISFVHSLVAALLASYELYSTPWILDGHNSNLQNKIMEWSMSFFAVDLFHYAAVLPSDHLFIAHHLATLTYILSCRYYALAGGKSVMCLIAAGEITTPLQAIWTLALLRREESRFADRAYSVLSPIFTVAFTAVRGLLGPYLLWELLKFYLWGHGVHAIPKWLAFCWMIKVAAGVAGSCVWAFKLWSGLLKFYIQRMRIFRSYGRGRRYD